MIDAARIQEIAGNCLLDEKEIPADFDRAKLTPIPGAIFVDGIVNTYVFNIERLKRHKNEIKGFLEQLPDQFHLKKGGGWSFLNACEDKDGNLWGQHIDMERLFCLGIGLGYVTLPMPKEMWSKLPGQMPFYTVSIE